MNDNAPNSDHSSEHTAHSIFTLYSHKVSILIANVYVSKPWRMAVTGLITPVLQKAEKPRFFK